MRLGRPQQRTLQQIHRTQLFIFHRGNNKQRHLQQNNHFSKGTEILIETHRTNKQLGFFTPTKQLQSDTPYAQSDHTSDKTKRTEQRKSLTKRRQGCRSYNRTHPVAGGSRPLAQGAARTRGNYSSLFLLFDIHLSEPFTISPNGSWLKKIPC